MCKLLLRIFGYPPSEKTKKVENVTIIGFSVLKEITINIDYFFWPPQQKTKKVKNVTVIERNNDLHF